TVDIPYTTCDNGVPSACASATLHIVVEAPVRITRPDVNSGQVNTTIPGDVSTNDNVPAGTTYGTPPINPGNPSNSVPTVNSDGTYTFTTNTPGVYEFDVPVNVPGYPSTTEKLTITVTNPALGNNPPVALDDYSVTAYERPINYLVTTNDGPGNTGGTLGAPTVMSGPTHGNIVVETDGTWTYTPDNGYSGTDEVTYQVCETPGTGCATATWYITVQPAGALNSTFATDDYYHTVGTASVNGNVKDNDRDPEGHDQTVNTAPVTLPSNIGTFAWTSPNGAFEFTAAPGFAGTVDIPYTTCDNGVPSACASATIHIVVEAPVVITRPDVNSGLVNEPIPGDVSTNDDVPPGTTYGTPIGSVSNPNNNTPVMDPDGSYTFETDKPGIYEFEIPVCVPGVVIPCPTETLIITVTDPAATNNPPILV